MGSARGGGLGALPTDPLTLLLPLSYKGLVAEALRQLVGEECYRQDEVLPPGYCTGSGAGRLLWGRAPGRGLAAGIWGAAGAWVLGGGLRVGGCSEQS